MITEELAVAVAEAISYTNLVPTSVDTNRNIFNGTGYQDGYRLSSSGATKEQVQCAVTGFMPATPGCTVRIAGMRWNNTSTSINYLCAYKSDFTFIGAVVSSGSKYGTQIHESLELATTDYGVNTVKLLNISDIAFIRVSCYDGTGATTGKDIIITVNEEII